MKSIMIVILIIVGILFLTTSQDVTQDVYTDTTETPNKTYLDTPTNTYKRQVEALSISNTLQNPNSYLGSRVNARESSKKAVNEANKRIEEQNKAMEALIK